MVRTTRNSRESHLPVDSANSHEDNTPSSNQTNSMNFVLSPADRQAIVQDVAKAVLEMSSTIATHQNTAAPTTEGMSVPSFISTFSLPTESDATHPVLSSSMLGTVPVPVTMNTATAPLPATSSGPQPFLLGPGFPPVPAKTVADIVNGKFVELGELLAKDIMETESEAQLFANGQLLLTPAARRHKHTVEDILSWLEAFTIYSIVMTRYHSHRWRDLSLYKMFIIRTYRQFGGRAWLSYDRAFRQQAAVSNLCDWSVLDGPLFSFHTASTGQHSHFPVQRVGRLAPTRINNAFSNNVCISWNAGQCIVPGSCRFRHQCSFCNENHRYRDCNKPNKVDPFKRPTTSTVDGGAAKRRYP